jgi:hypothetical protein
VTLGMTDPFMDAAVVDEPRPNGFREESLAPVYELNELFIETLAQAERHPVWAESGWQDVLGMSFSELGKTTRIGLARVPVCLLDVGLRDLDTRELTHPAPSQKAPPPFLARDCRIELTQMTLTLLWTMARTDPTVASIVFALRAPWVKAVAAWRVHHIPAFTERLSPEIRPVWLNRPRIWAHLFGAADTAAVHRFPPVCVRILQRQFADLVPATCASRSTRTEHP